MTRKNRKVGLKSIYVVVLAAALPALLPAASATTDISGTVYDSSGQPVVGETVTVQNCNTGSYTTVTSSGSGAYSTSGATIGATSGSCVSSSVTTTHTCLGLSLSAVALGTMMSWQPYTTTDLTTLTISGAPQWNSKLDLGLVSSIRNNGGGVASANSLGAGQAVAQNGLFDVEADLQFGDFWVPGGVGGVPVMNRRYDLDLSATYVGYIDAQCSQVAAGPVALGANAFAMVQYANNVGVAPPVTSTETLTGLSSAQGQPANAQYLVIQVNVHIVNTEQMVVGGAFVPSPADFVASGTYWVRP